jgi:ATP-dependent DNA helicase RecG
LICSSTDAPTKRIREIERSQDGFYLAEVDLKLRGPGEIYGSLQHGALDLRIASITDTKLVHKADQLVKDFLKQKLNVLEYKELSAAVKKYQRLTTLN